MPLPALPASPATRPRWLFLTFALAVAGACATERESAESGPGEPSARRYWVNSALVDCGGAGAYAGGKCLEVQRGDTLAAGAWAPFAAAIEGFEYAAGQVYHLRVGEVPAAGDAPARYRLVELINRTPDTRLQLRERYVLEAIGDERLPADLPAEARPTLELDVTAGRVSGTDGCNRFRAAATLGYGGAIEIGELATTRRACPPPRAGVAEAYATRLRQATGYALRGGKLTLSEYDERGLSRRLLLLRPVDGDGESASGGGE